MTTSPISPEMAMEIMLNKIFDDVFYKTKKQSNFCGSCDGDGEIEVSVPRPHNFNRDIGVIDVKKVECSECGGLGIIKTEVDQIDF